MQGEAQAIQRCAPAPVGSGEPNATFDITPALDGSSQWSIPNAGAGKPGCWITLTNYSDAVIRFCVGRSDAAKPAATNAAAGDNALVPGATQDYWCNPGWDRVNFRGAATPGVSAHRSSL